MPNRGLLVVPITQHESELAAICSALSYEQTLTTTKGSNHAFS